MNKYILIFLLCSWSMLSCEKESIDFSASSATKETATNSILHFEDKQTIAEIVSKNSPKSRNLLSKKKQLQKGEFISLMDKVQESDTLLNKFSEEEKKSLLEEGITYYELLGYEELVPNERFARLLNTKGEIIANDTIYKIVPQGTLCTPQTHYNELEDAYHLLQSTNIEFGVEHSIQLTPNVTLLNSYTKIEIPIEEETENNFPFNRSKFNSQHRPFSANNYFLFPEQFYQRFTSESHTFVGKILGSIFGDRSVKHNEFMKGFRVKGSLYDYDYGVYTEIGAFVGTSRKRGGFFRKINGWKDIQAQELRLSFRDLVLEMHYNPPPMITPPSSSYILGSNTTTTLFTDNNKSSEVIDLYIAEVAREDFHKALVRGAAEAINFLKGQLGSSIKGGNQVVRCFTPNTAYLIVEDADYTAYNEQKMRKVISSGVRFFISTNMFSGSASNNAFSALKEFYTGIKNMPTKKIISGRAYMAAKVNDRWGGMVIEKKQKK